MRIPCCCCEETLVIVFQLAAASFARTRSLSTNLPIKAPGFGAPFIRNSFAFY